jgi:hypothetical protein
MSGCRLMQLGYPYFKHPILDPDGRSECRHYKSGDRIGLNTFRAAVAEEHDKWLDTKLSRALHRLWLRTGTLHRWLLWGSR